MMLDDAVLSAAVVIGLTVLLILGSPGAP